MTIETTKRNDGHRRGVIGLRIGVFGALVFAMMVGLAVKYCPVTGKRYAADIAVCPVHKVDLKLVEP